MSINAVNNNFVNYISHYILKTCLMDVISHSPPYPSPQNLDAGNFSFAKELHFLSSISVTWKCHCFLVILLLLDKIFQMGFKYLFTALSDLTSAKDFIARWHLMVAQIVLAKVKVGTMGPWMQNLSVS